MSIENLIDEELLDFCFNYKDNPVPSLDIIDYENLLYLCEQAAHKPGLAGKQVYINLYNKLNIIQNGVETNKEQPKEYCKAKSELNRPTDYKNCDCHNFCKYDNIQFDTSLG